MMKWRCVAAIDTAALLLFVIVKAATEWMLEWRISCVATRYGLLCPACGATRCLNYLVHGNITQAFSVNPYIFTTVLLGFGMVIYINVMIIGKGCVAGDFLQRIVRPAWVVVWAVGFVVFGVIRNVLL